MIPLLCSLACAQGMGGTAGFGGKGGFGGGAAGGGGGTAAFVQIADGNLFFGGSGTTESVALVSTPGAGSAVVLMVGWQTATSTISSVVDGNSAAYTLVTWASGATNCQANGADLRAYVLPNSAGNTGAKTVTITWSADPGFGEMALMEWSGVPTASPVDIADCSGTNSTTTPTSPSVTTTGADGLYAYSFSNGASSHAWTAGTVPAYVFRGQTGKIYGNESFVQGSGAAVTGNFTITGADNMQTAIVALKP